jgi:large subunit ribosomal protein L34e
MPRPSQRMRSKKRIRKASPGGGKKIHYRQKVTSLPHCCICGKPLSGIPHLSTVEVRKLNRSKRRIQRFYGGQICPNCLKEGLRQAARTV